MDCIITFGKAATYNKRKIIYVNIAGIDIPLDVEYTIEKYGDEKTWYFYKITDRWNPSKKIKQILFYMDDLRKLKKAITEQLPKLLEDKKL